MQEEYQYEDSDVLEEGSNRKKIIISILLVLAIILIIILLKSCTSSSNKPEPKKEINYESVLLDAGKKYFNSNKQLLPMAKGECVKVELGTLLTEVDIKNKEEFDSCDKNKTYVNVCKLENGSLQYTPWLSCTNKKSEDEYLIEKEGTLLDVKSNQTFVSFTFLPQQIKSEEDKLGEVEEIWKDEIQYKAYKTLETIEYYRYKDQVWLWNTFSKRYYTTNGDKSSAKDVKEYYTSAPASGYNNRDNDATVYKWYKEGERKKEYYKENGKEVYTTSAHGDYNIKDENQVKIEYFYREVIDKTSPKLFYVCATDSKGVLNITQQVPCGQQNPSYPYELKKITKCPEGYQTIGSSCFKFGPTMKACPSGKVCDRGSITSYKWYKYVGNASRTYYKSGSSVASGEKVYYKDSPASGYIKDEATKTTGYKYYKKIDGQTSKYYSEAPSSGATKTSTTKWKDWTDWSSKEPAKKSYRIIESRTKIKLRQINDASDEDFKDIGTLYLTEEELINVFKEMGYEVESLSDISNNGEISYKIKMYVRNKKEASK